MKKHTKIYLSALGFDETDYIKSELSDEKAVDIHHIIGRGKKGEDRIENLMALTREEHIKFGDKKKYMYFLLTNHRNYLSSKNICFDWEYFDTLIAKYEN